MSIAYSDIEVTPASDGWLLLRFRARNLSGEPWRRQEGFSFGSQLFDPETYLYIEEGKRTWPDAVVAPGEWISLELPVDLPSQPGRYHVYVSLMRENSGWFYARNWPFILLEVTVVGGRPAAWSARVTTARALKAAIFWRSARRAFLYPFQTIWRHRSLIRSMVRRDILGRYRGSFGGLFWTVLNPLLLMATYYFVFGVVLRTRFAGDPSRSGFVLYFLAGMLPWLPFSEAAGRAPTVLIEHRNFVKRLVFPLETLPVNLTAAGLVTQAFAVAIFLALLLAVRGAIPQAVLWLPALIAPQVMFTLGVCWFLAALGVYVRDLGQINGFLLTLWFFLTPICYPEASLPGAALPVLAKNPLFVLVRGFRQVLLEGRAPEAAPLAKLWLVAATVFILGHAWFYRLRRTFADVI